ncbi:MAG: M81 family metallopeptidase [Clostridia bacterium]
MKKKIIIGMISHETNVFSPVPTPLQAWKDRVFVIGNELIKKYAGTKSAVGAFIEAANRNDWEVIPTIATSATPSAPTDAATYKYLKENLIKPIINSNPDAVLLSVHGAMIAEGVEDPEGDIAQSIREIIGDKPLLLTMDLHGNITENMCNQCDGVFAYDTNPHIDGYERAIEATECLEKIFSREIDPINAYTHKPLMPPTINMRTAEGPMVELHQLAKEWEAKEGIINVSIFSGFPYGDVPHAGLSIVTTADRPYLDLAKDCSDVIVDKAWQIREQFLKEIPNAVVGLNQTQELLKNDKSGPVILADVADNPGGGGSGDTTALLREIIKRNIPKSAAAIIWDPETVQKAIQVGLGNSATFFIGGNNSFT